MAKKPPKIFKFFLIPPIFILFLIASGKTNIVIKVAHLQPNNPNIIHEPQILEMQVFV